MKRTSENQRGPSVWQADDDDDAHVVAVGQAQRAAPPIQKVAPKRKPAAAASVAAAPEPAVTDADFFYGHLLAWPAVPDATRLVDALCLPIDSTASLDEVRRLNAAKEARIRAVKQETRAAPNAHVTLRIPYKRTAFKLTYEFETPLTSTKRIVNATHARFSALASESNPIVVESVVDVHTGAPIPTRVHSFFEPKIGYATGDRIWGRRLTFFTDESALRTFDLHENEGKHAFAPDEFPCTKPRAGLRLRYCSNGAFESMVQVGTQQVYCKHVDFTPRATSDPKRRKRAYELEHEDRVVKRTYASDGAIARMIARRDGGELDAHFFEKNAHAVQESAAMDIVQKMIKFGVK